MRDVFSQTLVDLTLKNENIYLLTGDHGYALFDELRKSNPERYINAGVAEQNMVGVAAGMAKAGLIPIVYGLSSFVPIRVLEQIKLDICFENLKVILIGDGAGVVYSKLGVSHQSFEDISSLRALPNIRILSPSDKYEMKLCLEDAVKYNGPTYIRVGKSDVGQIHSDFNFSNIPGLHKIVEGDINSPIFLATGSMVKTAQNLIQKEFTNFGLYSVSMIKPLDKSILLDAVGNRTIITLEEHSVFGGLGGAVAEIISTTLPRKILILGIEDRFSDKCGSYEYLMLEHGLDHDSLKEKIKKSLV